MSVENVPAVVNIKTLKGRFMAHKNCIGWAVGVQKKKKEQKSVSGRFRNLNKEDYGVNKVWGFLLLKESKTQLKNVNIVHSLDKFSRLRCAISRLSYDF